MRNQNRRPDLVEKSRAVSLHQRLGFHGTLQALHLSCVECIEDRIALAAFLVAGSRPLRVLSRLRPEVSDFGRREPLCHPGWRPHLQRSIHGRMPGRAPARRLIDEINHVPLLQKIIRPSRAAIRRPHPVGGGLPRAMKKHQRIFLNNALRTKDLDIHLPGHHFIAWIAGVLAADVEIVPR